MVYYTRGVKEEEEGEEEGLFKADAVNEEDPERDRATQVYKTRPGDAKGGRALYLAI